MEDCDGLAGEGVGLVVSWGVVVGGLLGAAIPISPFPADTDPVHPLCTPPKKHNHVYGSI